MAVTITKELQEALFTALADAKRRRHEYLTLEHVLFALAVDVHAKKLLKSLGVDLKMLKQDLEAFFIENLDQLPEGVEREPQQTPTFQRVLQRAAVQVQSAGKDTIDAGHLLAACFREPSSHAVYVLEKQGVSRLDVLQLISHGTSKVSEDGEIVGADGEAGYEMGCDDDEGGKKNALAAYATELVARAKDGKIDPLIGREHELDRTIQVLCRRRKNNPIFVGDPGVGKTAIVEGLALRIAKGKVPEPLKNATIYALDMGALIAGTKFRGEFEARLKGVLAQLSKQAAAVLFIDEIHTIYGAGATGAGALDASNLLKPSLSSGQFKCIGATTFQDYKSVFEKDRALARRFQKIDVLEPSIAETVLILKGLKQGYESHHQVRYTQKALTAAAELSAKHINDRLLPDKAVDVIDEAGAMVRLRGVPAGTKITSAEIEAVVAKIARVPMRSVSASDKDKLSNLESELKGVIFGQDQAVQSLVSAIKLSRSGLASPEKPTGSFLFSGPTGVGKTELAKQLARVLGVEFLRFDMSEYMEKHTVSRLIGAPPGYVGFDQGGLLTDAVRKTPHAVLVLDEIEKAHPDVFNILLQVMDHATLTDNNGRRADFRNIVLIMTTNAGASELSREGLGFGGGAPTPNVKKDKAAIERTFSPEFRNRLDSWITFTHLAPATIEKVVDKFVGELGAQLAAKNVTLDLSAEARTWLREKGYDKAFGARPMNRLIQNEVKRPLADMILFGQLQHGGTAVISIKDDKIAILPQGLPAPEIKPEAEEQVEDDAVLN